MTTALPRYRRAALLLALVLFPMHLWGLNPSEAPGTLARSPAPGNPLAQMSGESSGEWIRAGVNTNQLVWGLRHGLLWGIPTGKAPRDGPRGLIRLWSPVLSNGGHDLVNFIAIEPVVGGRRGFSELERSRLDDVPGKRMWVEPESAAAGSGREPAAGRLTRLPSGQWHLAVRVNVEPFENEAHFALLISQRSDAPDEIELSLRAQPGGAPCEYCILTATMGNKARTRLLWLKDGPVSSLKLYPDYREPDFAPHRIFTFDRLRRSAAGEVVAAITTDEAHPEAVEPFPGLPHWRYAGVPVTQYWRKPKDAWRDDLHVAVNGRFTYWLSRQAIPGGIAFENFEMRERFFQGQRFVFGITRKTPIELGFVSPP